MSKKVKPLGWESIPLSLSRTTEHLEADDNDKRVRYKHYIPIHYLSDPEVVNQFNEFELIFEPKNK